MQKYTVSNKTTLLHKIKNINIPVYGDVSITLMAQYFIDNPYFQRLSDLKQLGTCYMIFPGANHTRFEHSIGTYYLADRITDRIKKTINPVKASLWLSKIPELKNNETHQYDDWLIELIKIAALCHDVGHGPYSHCFDDIFIKNSIYKDHPMATHEARSCAIVELIVKSSNVLSKYITENDIKFIQSIIDPDDSRTGFVYQIVSNTLNGLDVDKYDYINRDTLHTDIKTNFDYSKLVDSILVIDDKIVFTKQSKYNIHNLFSTRHTLHRMVYGHKGVISAQLIITQIMKILDGVIGISESILDLNNFVDMTDSYILQSVKHILKLRNHKNNPYKLLDEEYIELEKLQHKWNTHDLYPCVGILIRPINSDITKLISQYFNADEYFIEQHKVGFVSGNKPNPLDSIYIYDTNDYLFKKINNPEYEMEATLINKTDISHTISDIYQERVISIFRKVYDINQLIVDKETFKLLKN
jgi:HD superfamily phosphohydrolase